MPDVKLSPIEFLKKYYDKEIELNPHQKKIFDAIMNSGGKVNVFSALRGGKQTIYNKIWKNTFGIEKNESD